MRSRASADRRETVLITGGAGFIGCALATRLVQRGFIAVALDRLHPQVHPRCGRPVQLADSVDLLPIDVTSASGWSSALKLVRPDYLVHLAAETGTGQSLSEAARHANVNVTGTAEMLDALLRTEILPKKIVLASSRAVYGEGEWLASAGETFYPGTRTREQVSTGQWAPLSPDGSPAMPISSRADRTVPNPSSIYGATKLAQEHVLSSWCSAMDVSLTVLRLQNVYGPGQSLTNSYTGIVAYFATLAAVGSEIEVYEDGHILRDFVYIDDVVDALEASLTVPLPNFRILDIGSGHTTTVNELAQRVANLRGAPAPRVSGAFRPGDIRAASTDISPARDALDYRPRWDLEAGLTRLLAWMEEADNDGADPAYGPSEKRAPN